MSVIIHNFVYLLDFKLIAINIFSFGLEFSSEEDCISHFKAQRDKIGVICKCKESDFFWIKSRLSYECKSCKKRITLKSGTIMENSNLSFLIWYKTIFLMSATKKGFSAKEMQKTIRLETLRASLGNDAQIAKSNGQKR
jgi:Zn finger protein HypA/HybF involved in hydrogenase expression